MTICFVDMKNRSSGRFFHDVFYLSNGAPVMGPELFPWLFI